MAQFQNKRGGNDRRSEKKEQKSWTDLAGIMTVWGNQKESQRSEYIIYSASVARKDDDGNYDNLYFDVLFRKGEAPEIVGRFTIDIQSAFLTLRSYKNRRGEIVKNPAVMVLEYDVVE